MILTVKDAFRFSFTRERGGGGGVFLPFVFILAAILTLRSLAKVTWSLGGPAVERPVPVRTGTVCGLSPCCVVRLVSSTRGLALPSHEPACLGAATTQTLVRSDTVLASVFRPQRRDAISRSSLGGSALL